jgi:hypothetical protein
MSWLRAVFLALSVLALLRAAGDYAARTGGLNGWLWDLQWETCQETCKFTCLDIALITAKRANLNLTKEEWTHEGATCWEFHCPRACDLYRTRRIWGPEHPILAKLFNEHAVLTKLFEPALTSSAPTSASPAP